MIHYCNRIIEYSFYALFALVPLAFWKDNYELFEFNKMWVTFGISVVVMAAWLVKVVVLRHIRIQRTPLDIPLLLFLLAHIVSTIFSLDRHISIWGYYSRFNGGLLSIITYILLYYAFVSNVMQRGVASAGDPRRAPASPPWRTRMSDGGEARQDPERGVAMVKRLLIVSLICGTIVALWGLPSHFGKDPTCLLFRGRLDVSCWTEAFQPKVRIFSTLGQPNWLAAYLAILIPIAIAFAIKSTKSFEIWNLKFGAYLLLIVLFFLNLLFTDSQSGFVGLAAGMAILWLATLRNRTRLKPLLLTSTLFLALAFFIGQPIHKLDLLTYPALRKRITAPVTKPQTNKQDTKTFAFELGGTDSGKIRTIVWQGAIAAWLQNPLTGSGVETFAFAYYKHRPKEHNLTSEWDFLYNKAHNEYLNYLATTGVLGLGSYLAMIGLFLWVTGVTIQKTQNTQTDTLMLRRADTPSFPSVLTKSDLVLIMALLASYISILVSNFFGFSVVIVNLYFFLIPAFVFTLAGMLDPKKVLLFGDESRIAISSLRWIFIATIMLASFFIIHTLFRYWQADTAFALGYNSDRTGDYQQGYVTLHEAVRLRSNEPIFQDELSFNDAVIATALAYEKDATSSAKVLNEATRVSNHLVATYPKNVVFWKNRVRLFYTLSQTDPKYLKTALYAIQRARELAPTDAKIAYNLGILYGQNNETQKAVETLAQTVRLKSDYRDAYYALGLFQRQLGENEKAISTMRFILTNLSPNDEQAKQALKSWGAQ